MIEIIGVPFDLCGTRVGSRLGPAAIRLENIETTLRSLGFETKDLGDVQPGAELHAESGFRHFSSLLEGVKTLRDLCDEVLRKGNMPLVLGGEHTMSIGCVSAALQRYGRDLGLIWIDAHGDVNTPDTSVTGNLHGMPLGVLLGLESETKGRKGQEWQTLLGAMGPQRIEFPQIVWLGLRDLDQAERERVVKGLALTMHHVDRYGVEHVVDRVDAHLKDRGVRKVWISFDVDALDPILAPGTGTAVRGGLSYRESHLLAELLRERLDAPDCPYNLVGIDVVETNPLADTNNETAAMAVEWVASLLGKTILGR